MFINQLRYLVIYFENIEKIEVMYIIVKPLLFVHQTNVNRILIYYHYINWLLCVYNKHRWLYFIFSVIFVLFDTFIYFYNITNYFLQPRYISPAFNEDENTMGSQARSSQSCPGLQVAPMCQLAQPPEKLWEAVWRFTPPREGMCLSILLAWRITLLWRLQMS